MGKDTKKNFLDSWKNKYRFVVLTEDTFEEKFSVNSSKTGVFVFLCFMLVFLVGGTLLSIGLTPLKEYIPGYTSNNMRRNVVELNSLSDSLINKLAKNDVYINNLKKIISGNMSEKTNSKIISEKEKIKDILFEKVLADSLLRIQIEEDERFSLHNKSEKKKHSKKSLFFKPIEGVITQGFDTDAKHFGIDIVAKENAPIKSVLDGVVVFSSWTSETGNVIGILHEDNLFSVYKHNSTLLKKQGEAVSAGEVIAIIGNSGKFSSGPHLHFELWQNLMPIDPQTLIFF